MPSWPTGVLTTTLLFGKGITVGGNMTNSRLDVTPMFSGTSAIVWVADGTPMLSFSENASADEGSYGSTQLPVVDQTGWVDSGQNAYTMWGYRLTETPYYGRTAGIPRVKYWQPLTGQNTVDFDLIPDGSLGLPVSGPQAVVTSVNGMTGAVTITGGGGGTNDYNQLINRPTLGTAAAQNSTAFDAAGAATAVQAYAVQRSNHIGTQTSSTISDFAEAAMDAAAGMIVAGTNITLAYNDAANTLTINAFQPDPGNGAVTVTDNGDGTFTQSNTVTDNGDGTFADNGSVTDNGDGTFTTS